MTQQQIVLCTCPDRENAMLLANTLVEEKLAACINILPGITSIYQWEGKTETGTELLLLIKTNMDRYHKLEQRILDIHPYELPEVISVPITGGLQAYLDWIDSNTDSHK